MNTVKGNIVPLRDNILVSEMDFEETKTASGIIIQSDDGKVSGIKPRWAKVWAIGPEQQDVKVGDWVYVEHGRWTRGIRVETLDGEIVIRMVDRDAVLLSADQKPDDYYAPPVNH